jgi:NadR type nicotinamide-nucleotide adenylyltransferase
MTVRVVALHGIESTGKSMLAARLADALGTVVVPEYGRDYCLEHGTDCSSEDLRNIAETQQAMIEAARTASGPILVTDTDWLMTRAWHVMMLGSDMPASDYHLADLYLHLAADVPWVDDGLRLHSALEERRRFDALCRAELDRAGACWVEIAGDWDARLEAALRAISKL